MSRMFCVALSALALGMSSWAVLSAAGPSSARQSPGPSSPAEISWYTDYGEAVTAAKDQGKMLFLLFRRPGKKNKMRDLFESKVLTEPAVAEKLRNYVGLKLPTDAKTESDGQQTAMLDQSGFRKMGGEQGVAILDYAHPDAEYYGCVVSTFPFSETHCYSARQTLVMLDLPPGTSRERVRTFNTRVRFDDATTQRESSIAAGGKAASTESPPAQDALVDNFWHTDYARAVESAGQQGKMLLICFYDPDENEADRRFQSETLGEEVVRRKLRRYVCARLPLDAKAEIDGEEEVLLKRSSLREMLGKPGVAIVDFAHPDAAPCGTVVSTFPLTNKLFYGPKDMGVILDLPPGTLTQRTLIYAVRVHPEKPASTNGRIDPNLVAEAESHSNYQARIKLQGHHHWETRFHRIRAKLPSGLTAIEVCAESWPGEHLVEAAVECVRCWRFSSGHWSAVRAAHRLYGYDMKRGSNGIWYATGIFGGK